MRVLALAPYANHITLDFPVMISTLKLWIYSNHKNIVFTHSSWEIGFTGFQPHSTSIEWLEYVRDFFTMQNGFECLHNLPKTTFSVNLPCLKYRHPGKQYDKKLHPPRVSTEYSPTLTQPSSRINSNLKLNDESLPNIDIPKKRKGVRFVISNMGIQRKLQNI